MRPGPPWLRRGRAVARKTPDAQADSAPESASQKSATPSRSQADVRLIASQKREIEELRAANRALRIPGKTILGVRQTRRSRALAALAEATQRTIQEEGAAQKGRRVLAPLTPPLRFGHEMGAAIVAELRAMTIETRRLVRALAGLPDAKAQTSQITRAMDAPPADTPYGGPSVPDDAQRKLDALLARYRGRFEQLATTWSRNMVAAVERNSTAQLSIGLKDVAERMEITSTMATPRARAVVEASTKSCTQLIKRIPEQYLGEVQVAVMSAITTGAGLEELVPYLTKRYEDDARHARLVALDQVRKATANFNAARLQEIGVEEYVWIHTGGERYPRKLHQSYHGKTFRYDDPPIIEPARGNQPEVRGKPGDTYFCRCTARPVLKFSKQTV